MKHSLQIVFFAYIGGLSIVMYCLGLANGKNSCQPEIDNLKVLLKFANEINEANIETHFKDSIRMDSFNMFNQYYLEVMR